MSEAPHLTEQTPMASLLTPSEAVAPAPEPQFKQRAFGRGGVRVSIRGRSLKLRGLHRPPTGLLAIVAILGPGLLSATAGDDAGGVATYS